jgi:hypothetical protein
MQKVVGSNPIIRFGETRRRPENECGTTAYRGWRTRLLAVA